MLMFLVKAYQDGDETSKRCLVSERITINQLLQYMFWIAWGLGAVGGLAGIEETEIRN